MNPRLKLQAVLIFKFQNLINLGLYTITFKNQTFLTKNADFVERLAYFVAKLSTLFKSVNFYLDLTNSEKKFSLFGLFLLFETKISRIFTKKFKNF